MIFDQTPIDGCVIAKFDTHYDDRGSFQEAYSRSMPFPSMAVLNQGWSEPGVLRGLHLQTRVPQGKLVRCLVGTIYDVCLDVRRDSPTFGQHVGMYLGGLHSDYGVYCPPGTAHGFKVVGNVPALVMYLCTDDYDPEGQAGLYAGDPELGIAWPNGWSRLSDRDKALPSFREFRETLR